MRISDWGSDVCSSDLDWFGLLDAQTRNARAWQRLFAHYDAVIAPAWGTTAFPHDDTPITERRLDVDGEDTQFGLQLAWPGLATFPMLPATSVPIGKDAEGLPIGVQVIADKIGRASCRERVGQYV